MIIFNNKHELATKYMWKDEVVLDIHSDLSIEEIFDKVRAGEELDPQKVIIAAYKVGDGEVETLAEHPASDEVINATLSQYIDTETYQDQIEDDAAKAQERPKMFQAFEAFLFHRAWRGMDFTPFEISREDLLKELAGALCIMPTLSLEGKTVKELKRLSQAGDMLTWRNDMLLWNAGKWKEEPLLPTEKEINFYLSLNDYERRVFAAHSARVVHPLKVLYLAAEIKRDAPKRLLTREDVQLLESNQIDPIVSLSNTPLSFAQMMTVQADWSDSDRSILDRFTRLASYERDAYWSKTKKISIAFEVNDAMVKVKNYNGLCKYFTDEFLKGKVEDETFFDFLRAQVTNVFFTKSMADAFANVTAASAGLLNDALLSDEDLQAFLKDPKALYEEFTKTGAEPTKENITAFLEKNVPTLRLPVVELAEEKFKAAFHGHAPRVLEEYMAGELIDFGTKEYNPIKGAMGGYYIKDYYKAFDEDKEKVADFAVKNFDQKNISKIAAYKNPALFALSNYLNFSECRDDHIALFGTMIGANVESLIIRGFPEWYLAHKDTNVSDLARLLNVNFRTFNKFDKDKTADDLINEVLFADAIKDQKAFETKYHVKFDDNCVAIRGRGVVAKQGKLKMYMLPAKDLRNFTVGYDTHCCQHFGNAGETCVLKIITDPFSACVVIERDGAILAQSFVWTDEALDTLVFDNVEFADDRNIKQFSDLFAAWAKAMPYKNIHVGVGYNQGMKGWGKQVNYNAVLPTTVDGAVHTSWGNKNCYTDYHADARELKGDGFMRMENKLPVQITREKEEPTKWDILADPSVSFLLNDCKSSIESRISFAKAFKENPTPEIQVEAVKRNPAAIRYIEDPVPEAQVIAVTANNALSSAIKNPCPEIQEILISTDPGSIKNITNPSENICRIAVQADGLLIKYIERPSETVKRMAVEQNGYAIRSIPESEWTDELCIQAVRSNPKVVSFMGLASDTVKNAALDLDPHTISLIDHPSREVQMHAVSVNPSVITEIKDPDYDAVYNAVRASGLLIRNFQYQYPQLRAIALSQNGFVINILKNPTDEEYVIAARQNPAVLRTIRNPEKRMEVEAALHTPAQDGYEVEFE